MNIRFLFYTPSIVDLFQVVANEKENIDFVFLTIAIITGIIGSGVRVAYEKQSKKVSSNRILFILICSLAVSYGIYEFTTIYKHRNFIGLISILGGIISIDIIKFIIEDLPSIGKEIVRKQAKLENKNKDNNKEL